MVIRRYIPGRGDICWASLDPTLGHEQRGRRPVLVISHLNYNEPSRLVLVCPITSVIKNYPYEVKVATKGVVLADHVRSMSWPERNFKFITKASPDIVTNVLHKIKILLEI